MHVIEAQNVNDALARGVRLLQRLGARTESRNGPVLVAPAPVMTVYHRPWERVLFAALRDANPFFHLFEALWMLDGRNDLPFLKRFNKQMELYSDDGGMTQPGAYGYRWRRHFGYDQLELVVEELKRDSLTRRVVLAMWDGMWDDERGDLGAAARGSADVPCNTHVYFTRHNGGRLDMTVCCRSNDIVWGAYGANAVHFSFLQAYVAAAVNCAVGRYYQLSNNYHAYIERPDTARLFAAPHEELLDQRYTTDEKLKAPAFWFGLRPQFDEALHGYLEGDLAAPNGNIGSSFLAAVAVPMARAHALHKDGNTEAAIESLRGSPIDWHVAGREWLERRLLAKKAAAGAAS